MGIGDGVKGTFLGSGFGHWRVLAGCCVVGVQYVEVGMVEEIPKFISKKPV